MPLKKFLDIFQQHLRIKVISLILSILILGFGVLATHHIRRDAELIVTGNLNTARLLSASIVRSIENGMLEGRPDIIRRLVHELKAELKDIRRLDVYRRNGVEAFTDLETLKEVNRIAGLDAEVVEHISKMRREPGARISHPLFGRAVETMARQETYEMDGSGRVLTLFWPLRNLKECQACHGQDHQVRGVLRVSLGLDKLDAELLEQVKGELVKFVPEAVTRLLEKNPDAREMEKRETDVSVLFLDVEGYTRLSEQLPPQRLNRMIQDYFSSFLDIIRAKHGDVNETAGDGLMVIFQSEEGPARHALNVAGAAFQLLAKVVELNDEFAGIYPSVAIHVGINSGPALVGATKLDAAGGGRWTFTASGPTTNLAARIAGLTKGGEVMVGAETAERIKGQYVLEDTGEHQLKNVSRPVRVFRLVPPGVYTKVAF